MTKWQRAVSAEIERWEFVLSVAVEWPQFHVIPPRCQILNTYIHCRYSNKDLCPLRNYGIQKTHHITCVGAFDFHTDISCFLYGESAIPDSMAILTWLHELATFTEKEIRR